MSTRPAPTTTLQASATGHSRAMFTDGRESVVDDRYKRYGARETRRIGGTGAVVASAVVALDLYTGHVRAFHPLIVFVACMYLFGCLWLLAVPAPVGAIRFNLSTKVLEPGDAPDAPRWMSGLIASVVLGGVVGAAVVVALVASR